MLSLNKMIDVEMDEDFEFEQLTTANTFNFSNTERDTESLYGISVKKPTKVRYWRDI